MTTFPLDIESKLWVVFGDTHANIPSLRMVCEYTVATGRQGIISVGDFGHLPRIREGREFIIAYNQLLSDYNLHLILIDGNHDDHAALAALDRDDNNMGVLGPRARHAPRGCRFLLGGTSVLAAGGAVSIDQHARTLGVDYWPEEVMSFHEVNACIDAGKVDVVIAHDTPAGIGGDEMGTTYLKLDAASDTNRRTIRAIVEATSPSVLYHGHYHHRRTAFLQLDNGETVRVEGLGRDGSGPDLYTPLVL